MGGGNRQEGGGLEGNQAGRGVAANREDGGAISSSRQPRETFPLHKHDSKHTKFAIFQKHKNLIAWEECVEITSRSGSCLGDIRAVVDFLQPN